MSVAKISELNKFKAGIRVCPKIGEKSIEINKNRIVVSKIDSRKKSEKFDFDWTFDDSCNQNDVYKAVGKPLVDFAILGFNATLFACEIVSFFNVCF